MEGILYFDKSVMIDGKLVNFGSCENVVKKVIEYCKDNNISDDKVDQSGIFLSPNENYFEWKRRNNNESI